MQPQLTHKCRLWQCTKSKCNQDVFAKCSRSWPTNADCDSVLNLNATKTYSPMQPQLNTVGISKAQWKIWLEGSEVYVFSAKNNEKKTYCLFLCPNYLFIFLSMTSWKMMQMKRKYSAVQVTGLHLIVTVHFSFCCFWPTNGSNIGKKEDRLCTLIKTIWSIQSQIFKTRNTDQVHIGILGIDTMMNHNNPIWTAVCLTWWHTTSPPGRQSIVTWFWRVRRFQTLHCPWSMPRFICEQNSTA